MGPVRGVIGGLEDHGARRRAVLTLVALPTFQSRRSESSAQRLRHRIPVYDAGPLHEAFHHRRDAVAFPERSKQRKRRSFPVAFDWGEGLQTFGAKVCKPLRHILQFGDRMHDQVTAGVSRLKAQGISSSMRDCGWPSAIASSVAFIQA